MILAENGADQNILSAVERFMLQLPLLSRPIIKRHFRQPFDVNQKADNSPVTQADKEVESVLRAAIAKQFPDHALIGEEQGGQADKPYCWVIDPIDGTRAFVIAKPIFGTLVGFVYEGQPVCGLIDMPALDETYFTRGKQAFCSLAGQEQIIQTSPEAFTDHGWQCFQNLVDKCLSAHYGGDCYNYALLASGHLDLVMEHQLAPHDLIALVPIMRAAGAVVTDWSGKPPVLDGDGSLLAAGDAGLHKQALQLINDSAGI